MQEDVRCKYGTPPPGNVNYAWISHMIHKLSSRGTAGFVLANGSISTTTTQESAIRKAIIENNLVDCIVTLLPNLFYNVSIPVCLWLISKSRDNHKDKILFIDARNMGEMVTRKHRVLKDDDLAKICETYHTWRDGGEHSDTLGFCKSTSIEEVRENEYVLTSGRYVGIEQQEDDGEPFSDKMTRLTSELYTMFDESHKLENEIKERLGKIGY